MNLNDIIQAAQGGQGVNNLAAQFGLTPEQAQAAINAMIPALSGGLQQATQSSAGLGGILSQLASGAHNASFNDPTQTAAAANMGGNVLGQIFGSPQLTQQIGAKVSQISGVDPSIIAQMMPAVTSMVMGGLAHGMNSQGLGGVLGQLAGAAGQPGGLGAAPGQAAQGGGLFGAITSAIGGLLGGGAGGAAQSPALQAGLSTLTNMLEAGVQVSQTHQQGLNDILAQIAKATQK